MIGRKAKRTMAAISESSIDVKAILAAATVARDALPYTDEFDKLYAQHASPVLSQHDFWRVLSNAGKQGGVSGKQRGQRAPGCTHQDLDVLRQLLSGRFGKRDDLPYTQVFEHACDQFNAATKKNMSRYEVWRVVCKISKQSLPPDVGLLLTQSVDSLVLGIEQFNRPQERCRKTSVLLMLDHAFEMLLKAALIQRGVEMRRADNGYSHGMDFCLNKATDDGDVRFLSNDERRMICVLNGLRDQAQHYLVDVSEQMFYLVAQGTVTLFAAVLSKTFGQLLGDLIPSRVLPISTDPPRDIQILMDEEYAQLQSLFNSVATASEAEEPRLRSLITVDRALQLEDPHVSDTELEGIKTNVRANSDWSKVFAGIAQVELSTTGGAGQVTIHLTKKCGAPVRLLQNGDDAKGAAVLVQAVHDTETYCFSSNDLAKKLAATGPRVREFIDHLELKNYPRCFRRIKFGKNAHDRYSAFALVQCRNAIEECSIEEVWRTRQARPKKPR